MQSTSFRHQLAKQLDPALKAHGLSLLNIIILNLIVLSILLAFLETEKPLYEAYSYWFHLINWTIIILLIFEYFARIWVSSENPLYRHRWHYLVTYSALLDLITIVFMCLTSLGAQLFILRIAQFVRIARLAKLGKYSLAMKHIRDTVRERKDELFISFGMAFLALIISSAILYHLECDAQPEKFGSMPRAMWWSICTLTTVGYGDVYPVTAAGKFFAGLTAIAGIGFIALPAGILAASFSDAMQRIRKSKKQMLRILQEEALALESKKSTQQGSDDEKKK